MYCAYKSFVTILMLLFGFSTFGFADPLTELQISAGEETQYTVGEIIIIDNDNQKESYIIDSIDNGQLNLQKNVQNGFDMNVIGTSAMKVYPVPWRSEFTNPEFIWLDSIIYGSVYPVGTSQYIDDIEIQLEFLSNNWPAVIFQSNYYFEGAALRANTYFISGGAVGISQYIKIFALVNGNYISNGGLTLNVVGNYGDVDIETNIVLTLAGIIVVAIISIFVVKKLVSLANKT